MQNDTSPECLPEGMYLFWICKRIFDIAVAILLLPVVLLTGVVLLVLNPFFNPGKLLYSQERVGLNGKIFRIHKFRTMIGHSHVANFASSETDRITPFGKMLRLRRFDELPQIINILKGEMSFIGPRPEQLSYVNEYLQDIPNYGLRHKVRPGISGLAQVEHGYTSDTKGTLGKVRYDICYIRNIGFRMDTYILWRTLITVMTGSGAQ